MPGGNADRWLNADNTSYCIYATAKAAVIHFSENMAKHLLPHRIRVTCLCPGGVATPLWTNKGGYPDPDAKLITVEDMNNLVQFLIDQLEEEALEDQDYYINRTTLDIFEVRGADLELLSLLRGMLGERKDMDIRWSKA